MTEETITDELTAIVLSSNSIKIPDSFKIFDESKVGEITDMVEELKKGEIKTASVHFDLNGQGKFINKKKIYIEHGTDTSSIYIFKDCPSLMYSDDIIKSYEYSKGQFGIFFYNMVPKFLSSYKQGAVISPLELYHDTTHYQLGMEEGKKFLLFVTIALGLKPADYLKHNHYPIQLTILKQS